MIITINVPIFPARVIVTDSRAAFTRMRNKHDDSPIDLMDCNGISSDFGPIYLVGVFDRGICTLVHELAHTTFKILRDVNVPVGPDAQESFCYLQDWLVEKSVKIVWPPNKF